MMLSFEFSYVKEPPTSRHFINKLTHFNSVFSKVQNQMRKKYFQHCQLLDNLIFFSLYILLRWKPFLFKCSI